MTLAELMGPGVLHSTDRVADRERLRAVLGRQPKNVQSCGTVVGLLELGTDRARRFVDQLREYSDKYFGDRSDQGAQYALGDVRRKLSRVPISRAVANIRVPLGPVGGLAGMGASQVADARWRPPSQCWYSREAANQTWARLTRDEVLQLAGQFDWYPNVAAE